jgi:hypothetical protein
VTLPDIPLHPSQREAVALIEANRRVCLVCGRRWGKSTVIVTLAVDYALSGRNVAIFAPTHRWLRPLFDAVMLALGHLPGVTPNGSNPDIKLAGGAYIDFWSIDVTQRSGRGQKYHLVLIDEAAHDENDYLTGTLEAAIAPATLDFAGKIVLASTPNGLDGAFWQCATIAEKGYVVHHAPTSANPHLPVEEIAYLRSTLRSEIASQELDAIFLDVGGASIFPLNLLLVDGEPHPDDGWSCDVVGVAIDSNSGKGGEGRDGCAAAVFGLTLPSIQHGGSLQGAGGPARLGHCQLEPGPCPRLVPAHSSTNVVVVYAPKAIAGLASGVDRAGRQRAVDHRGGAGAGLQPDRDRGRVRHARQGQPGAQGRAACLGRTGEDRPSCAGKAHQLPRRDSKPFDQASNRLQDF